jgi:two-component system nitrate/nitrite response regulator NarL
MTETPLRILVADDHTVLRQALCDLLDLEPRFEVVAQADSGESTVRLAERWQPDVVLLDIEMPSNDPPTTVRRLLTRDPTLRIVVLSMYDTPDLVRQFLYLGVHAYIHKSASMETLTSAILAPRMDQQRTVTITVSPGSLLAADPVTQKNGLSARELEVLTSVADALSNRQIATRLNITEGTVKRHLRNIFGKLGAVSRIDAVKKATAQSLIGPGGRSRDASWS